MLFSVVLANGTTRLQLDIIRSSKLPFDTLFSSQLLQATKVWDLTHTSARAHHSLRSQIKQSTLKLLTYWHFSLHRLLWWRPMLMISALLLNCKLYCLI
jgi:hypothetical protein